MKNYSLIFLFTSAILLLLLGACKDDDGTGMGLSSAADITSFSFTNPSATGQINGTAITVEVPFGTNVTSLAPTISISAGAIISPASGLARDFSAPVNYVVTAQDGITEKTYTVAVTVADPTQVVITAFEVVEAQTVDIDQQAFTITLNIADGTDVTALVPIITTNPAGATLVPASGVPQDFTDPVTYTATQGGVESTYTISVNFITYGFDVDNVITRYDANVASSTLPSELSDMGDNERGFSMNSSHVYVADKGDNEVFFYANDGSSAAAGTLNKNDADGNAVVSGGIFGVADVFATENGILASNMSWDGGDFKVYRWANNTAPAELILTFPCTQDGASIRLGDAITFSGDIYGNGKLYVMPFPGFNSVANNDYVLVWDMVNGSITNASSPDRITFTNILRAGNYGYVMPISADGENYLLVNGAELVPSLWSADGSTRLTDIATDAIGVRTLGGEIFEYNDGRYLAVALPGSEGGTIRNAGLAVYDITGGTLLEAMNALTAEAVLDRLVYTTAMGQQVNGNVAADVSVYLDPVTNKVLMMAGACNNGFRVVEAGAN